jgi:hypothetical protein
MSSNVSSATASLPQGLSIGDQSPKSSPATSPASRRRTSLPAAGFGQLQLDLLGGLTNESFGPAPAHANQSRSPGIKKVLMIPGIYGPTFIDSSALAVQPSSWVSKFQEKMAIIGSTESPLIWKVMATPQKRSIFRLAPSTARMFVAASTGARWSTPTVQDAENTAGPSQFNRNTLPLNVQAVIHDVWPTPVVSDVTGGRKHRSGKRSNELLLNGLAHGTKQSGSKEQTGSSGALSPAFVFWLMGFPAGWVSSALAAMQSLPRSRRLSSKR